ncbi:beta-ketoacyl-[acyl-carrier-protein] synthase family protein [Rhabdothermincola sediminis]|uniref:beta-ketoacyl-[acyl-carrier-protein] synthase family protein n=1 Tax=Rhabdothermincola sediminis TaxID=2751370 RepID=UPI001AA0546C|nr:beta-ketoacyl-[acyl-carrier-protein] synthase family protein [Rhabdothermincola sediminis]
MEASPARDRRRVAVTGVGVVSPCGIGAEAFWAGLLGPPPEGERRVYDFDPARYFDNPKEARRTDRFTQFALAAAAEALEQSGQPEAAPLRRGVWVGTGVGGLITVEDQVVVRHEKGARRVSPFLVPMMMANAAAAAISMRYGWQGPCETTVTACAAGTHSIANGARLISSGRCDAVIAGSSEAAMTATGIAGFTNMTALSSSGVSRPFDRDRDGFVMAEGGAVLVLEEWESAQRRGATILAEVLGSASTADAHHITAPSPDGSGAIACMQLALEDAGVDPSDVRHVNAHGTSTPLNDAAEAEAIAKLFGTPGPPITSIKGVTGHSLGAAGALEAVSVVLSMVKGLLPPTAGYEHPDPELPPIDVVHGEPRPWQPGPTLSNSFGFGGHNGCLVFGPPDRPQG